MKNLKLLVVSVFFYSTVSVAQEELACANDITINAGEDKFIITPCRVLNLLNDGMLLTNTAFANGGTLTNNGALSNFGSLNNEFGSDLINNAYLENVWMLTTHFLSKHY